MGGALLGRPGELGAGQDGDVQLARELLEAARDVADLLDAVVGGGAVDELEVVDDDEVQASLLAGQAAGLGPDLHDGGRGAIVDVHLGTRQDAQGVHDLAFLSFGLLAEAEAGGIDPGLAGEQPLSELVRGHLDAEEGYPGVLADGGVAGDVEGQAGLADARPGGHDDQVGALEAAQEHVQVGEAGAHRAHEGGADALDAGRLPEVLQQAADVDEVAELLTAAEGQDHVLGAGEDGVEVGAALVGHLGDLGGGADEQPVGGVAADDAGVVLDADGGGKLGDEAAEEADAADLFEALAAGQLVGDGDLIDPLVALPEGQAGLVGPAVLLAVEVLGPEDALDFVDGILVHQEGGDDGLLGLHAEGRQPLTDHHA